MRARAWGAIAICAGLLAGCGVKKSVKVDTPTGYLEARTASRAELIRLINDRYAGVRTLTVPKFKIQLTGGTIEDGELEKYRDAGGYLIAQRQGSIYVNILNPLSSTSVLTMASADDRFQVWIPSRNQFVTGATDSAGDDKNPLYNVRPDHILQGILVERLPAGDPARRVVHYEDQDARRKYYVIMITDASSGEMRRRLWIERSQLRLVRQQYYTGGVLVSDIRYEETAEMQDRLIGASLSIERPLEKYSVRLQLDSDEVTLDRPLTADTFQLKQPAGAERIEVGAEEKQKVGTL